MKTWAITTYFNPRRSRRRHLNYRIFRQALALPLLTVEWSPDGRFELSDDDAERIVRLRGGDLMWQKERLLNVAVSSLPAHCDTVAWLDCDILFGDSDWVAQLEAGLEEAVLLQLFSRVEHLPPSFEGPWNCSRVVDEPMLIRTGLVRAGAGVQAPGSAARHPDAEERAELVRLAQRPSSGHAWAARRELLEEHGFYDACIVGVGDMAFALAALGQAERFVAGYPLNPAQAAHYRGWADPFSRAVGGRVDYLPGSIRHLYHGRMVDRQYRTRLAPLADTGFDPNLHLAAADGEPWAWSGAAKGLRHTMAAYFRDRREDAA